MSRSEGVLDGLDNELAVSSSGGLAANVATGIATKGGRVYKNDAVVSPTLDAVSIGYKRIDRIVIRFDAVTNRSAVATIIKGTEVLIANAATAPAITSGTDVLLAQVLITNTAGSYSYAYTDERVYFRFSLDSIPAELTGKNAPTATTAAACSGNAATATILQTARTIGGVSFNGSANINLPGVNTAGNQNTSGNAATATTATNADKVDGLNFVTIDIGDWNMDATSGVSVSHGLTASKIRTVDCVIRNDDGSNYGTFDYFGDALYITSIGASSISLTRLSSGIFDSTDYNLTSYNRGWITIGCID
jgi:hypothetical protein